LPSTRILGACGLANDVATRVHEKTKKASIDLMFILKVDALD
jgi:multisubunit Na+/H+ antiporter MnhG subunit